MRPRMAMVQEELDAVLLELCPSAACPPRPSEPLVGYTSGTPGEWQEPHIRTLAGLAKDAVKNAPVVEHSVRF